MGKRQRLIALCAFAGSVQAQPVLAQQAPNTDVLARLAAVEAQVGQLRQENAELKAEVERLT